MKGLVIKDLMCIRKQLILFGYTVASVAVLSVMIVLSCRFGNLRWEKSGMEMMAVEPYFSEQDLNRMACLTLKFFLFLPIVCVGDFANVFEADGKAGFAKVSTILPISVGRRVLAKYVTILMLFTTGVAVDLAITTVLAFLTDFISFWDFTLTILLFASVMGIYGAIEIIFCFLFGYGKEDYARIAALLSLLVAAVILNLDRIKGFLTSFDGSMAELLKIMDKKNYNIFLIAVFVMGASYFASVTIAKRKRGVV